MLWFPSCPRLLARTARDVPASLPLAAARVFPASEAWSRTAAGSKDTMADEQRILPRSGLFFRDKGLPRYFVELVSLIAPLHSWRSIALIYSPMHLSIHRQRGERGFKRRGNVLGLLPPYPDCCCMLREIYTRNVLLIVICICSWWDYLVSLSLVSP